ncbi:MAG: hypothetical protein LBD06_10300 [Candidatus Accumulibacter sp.]|nr:hypothetical protein [Accumulibacter sp.]
MADTKTAEAAARDLPLRCPPGDAARNQPPRLCPFGHTRHVFKGETGAKR